MTKQNYQGVLGKQILHDRVCSAAAPVVYSEIFSVPKETRISTHHDWLDEVGDFEASYTFWLSNKLVPDESDDSDWVQMTTDHGFNGLPGGNPAGGVGKDMVNISAVGALHCRWKIEWTAGSAVLQGVAIAKVFDPGVA